MNRPVLFRPAARRDFLDACIWYEQQRPGLGDRFEASVQRTLDRISGSPEYFPSVYRDVRRAMIRPFPYGVFYRLRAEEIHVIAVMHGRRAPSEWRSRADSE